MKKENNVSWKLLLIIVGVVLGIILLIISMFVGTSNRIVSLEEQIKESDSGIKVQEKRRLDLINNLVDTVKSYNEYESSTLEAVTQARSKIDSGDIDEAKTIINAVAEQYPNLKSSNNYKQVMTEMAVTENLIANYRENYNNQVKSYNKYIRKFPTNIISGMMGYKKIDYDYLSYKVSSDAPTNLWD